MLLLQLPGMLLLLQAVVAMLQLLLQLLLRVAEALVLLRAAEARAVAAVAEGSRGTAAAAAQGSRGNTADAAGSSTGKLLQHLRGYLGHSQLSGAALVASSARRQGSSLSTVPARAWVGLGALRRAGCVKYMLISVVQVVSVPEPVPMANGHQIIAPTASARAARTLQAAAGGQSQPCVGRSLTETSTRKACAPTSSC